MTDTLDTLLSAYRIHKNTVDNSPPSAKSDRALERIERLVERAEKAGILDDFIRAANA